MKIVNVTIGNTIKGSYTFREPDGSPSDLTGYDVVVWIDPDNSDVIPIPSDDADKANGVITFNLHSNKDQFSRPNRHSGHIGKGDSNTLIIEASAQASDDVRTYKIRLKGNG